MTITLGLRFTVRDQLRNQPNAIEAHDRNISDWIIRQAINTRYKEGVKDKAIRRLVGPILKKLTLAVNEKRDSEDFSVEQVQFVLDSLEQYSAPPEWVSWVDDISEEFNRAKAAHDAEEKAKKEAPKS